MSKGKKTGLYIEGVKGGREPMKMAPAPTQRRPVTDGREPAKMVPTPLVPAPTQTTPVQAPVSPSTPKKT